MPAVPIDQQTLLLVLAVLLLALAGWVAVLHWSSLQLRRRLRAVFGSTGEQGLDEVLDGIVKRLVRTDERIGALSKVQEDFEALLRRGTIRNIGVVRFNPFPDAGGDQSFAIALLDSEGTGVVLSSLHGRTDTRVFAKPVEGGRSRYPLSEEEQDAIRKAQAHRA